MTRSTAEPDPTPERAPTRRTQARGREGRTRILQTMLTLVDERGFEGATIAELARRTGLPASSVYWHFASKDELVAAAIRHSYGERYDDRSPWPEEPDGRGLVDQLVDDMESLQGDGADADYIRIGLALSLQRATSAPAARSAFLEIRQEAKRRLGVWWGRMLDRMATGPWDPLAPEALARLTLAVLDGRYLTGRDVTLVPDNTRVLALLLAGVAGFYAAGGSTPGDEVGHGLDDRVWIRGDEPGRDALVAAAIEVLCDHGYPGATVSRICARAGLPASSLYWHFADLDALLGEAVDSAFERWRVLGGPWPDAATADYHLAVADLLRTGFANMLEEPAAFRIGFMLLLQRGDPEARRRFRRIRRDVVLKNAAWFADRLGVEAPRGSADEVSTGSLPGMLSWAVMTLVDGLFMVEAVSPLWALTDASDVIADGLESAMAELAGTG